MTDTDMPAPRPADDLARRAAIHRALADEHRLRIIDALQLSDRSPTQLQELTDLSSNLLAFHLDVLEEVGLITRTRSQGDGRRRYVILRPPQDLRLSPRPRVNGDVVAFVCTANSARSQLASRLWTRRTGRPGLSAGTQPADRVHPLAVEVARRHGLDLSDAAPRHYHDLDVHPDLVVSVCDRAHESRLVAAVPMLHWSVPDPAEGDLDDFEAAFGDLSRRIDQLADAAGASAD
jgi:protein-tyrosine-phosphatase